MFRVAKLGVLPYIFSERSRYPVWDAVISAEKGGPYAQDSEGCAFGFLG